MIHTAKKVILNAFVFLFVLCIASPFLVLAQTGPKENPENTGITYECVETNQAGDKVYGNCGYNDLIAAIKKVVKWGTIFALEFSVVVIAYAGFKYMTSAGNPGKIAEANKMFLRVVQGIILILAAWLIVTLITNALLRDDIKSLVPLK